MEGKEDINTMDFEDLFTEDVFRKGVGLVIEGKVSVVDLSENGIVAHVNDGGVKHVIVRYSRNNYLMSCSCAMGNVGFHCEHEAAAILVMNNPSFADDNEDYDDFDDYDDYDEYDDYDDYARDDKKTEPKIESGMVNLGKELSKLQNSGGTDYKSSYTYFRMDRILAGRSISKKKLERAKALLEKKEFELTDYTEFFLRYDIDRRIAKVEGKCTAAKNNNDRIYLMYSKDELKECYCGVRGCNPGMNYYNGGYRSELCEHTIALLILAAQYRGTGASDATNLNAEKLLSAYKRIDRKNAIDATESVEDVILEPRISHDGYSFDVGFKIGTDKLYILKDMVELVELYDNRGTLKLGKNKEISFGQHTFCGTSAPCFEFIKKYLSQRNDEYGRNYYYTPKEKEIPLEGYWLDAAFELMKGREVEYKEYGKKASTLRIEEKEFRPKLTVETLRDKTGSIEGVHLNGSLPDLREGANHVYYLTDNSLIRIPEGNRDALTPLLTASEDDDEIDLKFGRNMLGTFYNDILPRLSDICDIENNASLEVEAYVPPQAMFRFYLDATDDDITLGIEVAYDEDVFVLDPYEQPTDVYRDISEEQSVTRLAAALFESYERKTHLYHCRKDEDKVYHILEYGVTELMAIGEVNATDAFKRLRIRRDMKLTLGVSLSAGLLELDIQTDDISKDELVDILKSYKKKKKFHRLRNGDFVSLEDENTAMLAMLLNEMGVSPGEFVKGKMNLPAYRAVYLDAMLQRHEEIATERDLYFKNTIRQISSIRNSEAKPPKTVKNVLRNYQLYGFRFLSVLAENGFGGILADDMGLGKTLQVLTLLLSAKERNEEGCSIVICPASLVYNWMDEAERFAPQLRMAALAGTPSEREEILGSVGDYDVLVTSYNTLTRDIAAYEGISFNYQIVDEAQYIKNARTGAAKSVRLLHAAHRIALTGTPIENRLSELWSIFDFLMPGFLYGYEEFRRRFETPIAIHKDEEASERLRQMISPFVLRRLKKDVLKDLPDKLEESRSVALPDAQRKLYDAQVLHLQQMLGKSSEEEFDKSKIQILAEITKLRQICCDPALLFADYKKESGKREALMDLVTEAIDGGHKMLIFSQFTSMLDLIEQDLKKAEIAAYRIDGGTAKKERVRLVNDFNRNDTPVFLISLKAGGTGLNLTGADLVIHYDPWWNIAVQNQATDRAHRIGQKNVVSVFKLIAKGTIEEKIAKLQDTKKELADEILSGEGGSLTQMTREDLLELLG